MIKEKIKDRAALKKTISLLKKEGKKVVFTNGCFDIIHYGHVRYLEDAKKEGDILVVAVNSDDSVRKIKGENRPINGEKARMSILAALESVDYVTIFDEEDPVETIRLLIPDILVKGGDWEEDRILGGDIVKASGGRVRSIPFQEGYSTTGLIKKIKASDQ